MTGVFHEGELAMQERAGVGDLADRLGPRAIASAIPDDFAWFIAEQPFVVIAASGERVWTSALAGSPGFARAVASGVVEIHARIDDADPLAATLTAAARTDVGLLFLDPMMRGRVRINGVAERTSWGLRLHVREAFGNCPKYIQRRLPIGRVDGARATATRCSLDGEQRELVAAADTFFIGSRHPERGVDASHRGGRPGFVRAGAGTLTFPDYQGNNMFQTLGNLTVDPQTALLFVDWSTGRTLQIAGDAQIVWDADRIADWPGAQRLVDVHVVKVVDRAAGLPLAWKLVEAHRLNPAVPHRAAAPPVS